MELIFLMFASLFLTFALSHSLILLFYFKFLFIGAVYCVEFDLNASILKKKIGRHRLTETVHKNI